ncbi:MAG: hypothetical protein QME92_08550 [Bacillota bacterium]|nr:hypothetical protein [Bacillota bacterium]
MAEKRVRNELNGLMWVEAAVGVWFLGWTVHQYVVRRGSSNGAMGSVSFLIASLVWFIAAYGVRKRRKWGWYFTNVIIAIELLRALIALATDWTVAVVLGLVLKGLGLRWFYPWFFSKRVRQAFGFFWGGGDEPTS